MSGLKSILFIVVLIVAGVLVYRYLRRVPLSPEQFHSISHLTPDDLRARCGHPEQDTSGVVVEDDGIRDLRYRDAGGAELVFRFISEDVANWQSLGAWEQVNAPDDLGEPLPATEAVRRLPCATRTDTATSSLQPAARRRRRRSRRDPPGLSDNAASSGPPPHAYHPRAYDSHADAHALVIFHALAYAVSRPSTQPGAGIGTRSRSRRLRSSYPQDRALPVCDRALRTPPVRAVCRRIQAGHPGRARQRF